jgi:hypothetical protein
MGESESLYKAVLGGREYLFSAKQGRMATIFETDPQVRIVLALGAKQSGKTEGAALALMRLISQCPGEEFLILAPTYKKLHDSTLRKFKELCSLVPGFLVPSTEKYRPHSTEMKAELVAANGATIFYRSADKLSGLEGMTLRAAWIDEAQHIDEDVVDEIRYNRLRIKKGILFITAAFLRPEQWAGHWLEEYKRLAQANDPEIALIPFTIYDLAGLVDRTTGKPLLDLKEIESKKRSMNPQLFRAWILGEMESSLRDDRLFPPEAIKLAHEEWKKRFPTIPKQLYDFITSRAHERLDIDPSIFPPNTPKPTDQTLVIGVDVAELGGDNICISYRMGRTVLWVENWGGMRIPDLELQLAHLYTALSKLHTDITLIIDEGGLGKGIPSHLADLGVNAQGLSYNEAPSDTAFTSIKAELYFRCKDWLCDQDNRLAIPPIPALTAQLTRIRYSVEGDKKKLSIIKPKDSPDELDSIIVGLVAGDGSVNIFF